jgi:ribosome-associated protein
MSESYLVIELNHQPVELCKLLKIANLVSGGGEAKIVISEGFVVVNNEVEFQKRKKIRHGDIVEFNGEVIEVAFVSDKKSAKSKVSKNKSSAKDLTMQKKVKKIPAEHSFENDADPINERPKRRSISF